MKSLKKEIKEMKKEDPQMVKDFVSTMAGFMKNEDLLKENDDKNVQVKEFLKESPHNMNIAHKAIDVLKEKQYHRDINFFSEEFYNEMLSGVSEQLSEEYGTPVSKRRIKNVVGYELRPFHTVDNVLEERKDNNVFKEEFDNMYNWLSNEKPTTSKEEKKDRVIKIANTIKSKVPYHDKDEFTTEMYQSCLEEVENKIKNYYKIENYDKNDVNEKKGPTFASEDEKRLANGETMADVYNPLARNRMKNN